MEKGSYRLGILLALGAYGSWGVFPIYWKQLSHVPAMEVLASRFVWCLVFMLLIQLVMGKFGQFAEEVKAVFSTTKSAITMLSAAIMISFNWGIFIWAVEDGRILETSMGYYINPLMSVLFGVIFLHERLDRLQTIAVICAFLGIATVVYNNGYLPWVSVSLAFTFASYGLLKKLIPVSTLTSITLETVIISPLAIYYLVSLYLQGASSYANYGGMTSFYLICGGVVTGVPLLLFTGSAKLLPLKMVGFMQYIAPTISMLIGIYMYGEPFTPTLKLAFGLIWLGTAFFIVSQIKKQ